MFKNNRGFSLIEVLVTVGLIGILVGIAVPSYNKYKRSTLSMAVKADLGNGYKAYSAFAATDGTFCVDLESAGININIQSNTYKNQGYFGFGALDTSCPVGPGLDKNKIEIKSKGYCVDKTTNAVTSSNTAGDACLDADNKWHSSQFAGTTSSCSLGAESFDLGAYTKTSSLNTFFVINENGRAHNIEGATCSIVP